MVPSSRAGSALVSCVAHVLLLALALFIARMPADSNPVPANEASADDGLVFLVHAGKPGGGGGGGAREISRPRAAEVPGADRANVPVTQPPTVEVARRVDIDPVPAPVLAAVNLAAATELQPGVIEQSATDLATRQDPGHVAALAPATEAAPATGAAAVLGQAKFAASATAYSSWATA
jgi:hypothetical protein